MKRSIVLILVLMFLIVFNIFCESEKSLSFTVESAADTSYSSAGVVNLAWIYSYSSDFLIIKSGIQLSPVSTNIVFDGKAYLEFFKNRPFCVIISGGLLFHSEVFNQEVFLQDSFSTGEATFRIRPIFTDITFMAGAGFNNTYVFKKRKTSVVNGFYPIISLRFTVNLKDKIHLGGGLSSYKFFVYDHLSAKIFLNFEVKMFSNFYFLSETALRYTTDSNNRNMDSIDFLAGIKYAF